MGFISNLYTNDLNKIIAESQNPKERLVNVAWPSESMVQVGPYAVGECKRAMFYKILGVKQSNIGTVEGRHIMDAGIMYESYHIERFKKHGLYLNDQIRIEFEMPNTINKVINSGKLDVTIKVENKIHGIEIKSISAYKSPKIMEPDKSLPLPAANNLMQAMLYKYHTSSKLGYESLKIDDIYLMYVNRSDGAAFFYLVELDSEGFAILTAIDGSGKQLFKVVLQDQLEFNALLSQPSVDSDQARLAELRININDIFKKFDDVYTHAREKVLPPCDYKMIYTATELDQELHLKRISKIKYNKVKKDGESLGDTKCAYCSYRTQCLSDNGIKFK